jgi:membrane protease YdiL (CAAX protease family)
MTAFIIVAFALSWAWALPLAAAGDVVEKGRGWPTHFPALLGPALAALAVTAWASGRVGVRDLLSRMARWQIPVRWWAAALSPLAFLALALVIAALAGTFPAWGEFGRYSGLPAVGVVGVVLIATLVNGLGEETGWRGYLLPLLQLLRVRPDAQRRSPRTCRARPRRPQRRKRPASTARTLLRSHFAAVNVPRTYD